MFDKKGIEGIIKLLDLKGNDYTVIMDGAMVMKGYKIASYSLEIEVTAEVFKRISVDKKTHRLTDNRRFILMGNGNIRIIEGVDNSFIKEDVGGVIVESDEGIIEKKVYEFEDGFLEDIITIGQKRTTRS